jgi:hypothetical protein
MTLIHRGPYNADQEEEERQGRQRAIAPGAKKLRHMRRPSDESVLFHPGRRVRRGLRLRFLEGPSLPLVPRTCRAWLTNVGRPGRGSATLTIPIYPPEDQLVLSSAS